MTTDLTSALVPEPVAAWASAAPPANDSFSSPQRPLGSAALMAMPAIIGLSTALPRPPLVASGVIGKVQLAALAAILAHPEVRDRTPVILQHHPIHNPASRAKTALEGLGDAGEEARVLGKVRRGLLLHGHLHRRVHRRLATERGQVDAIGATSASLLHESDERMAGFNVYEVRPDGALGPVEWHRLVPETQDFREVSIAAS